MMVALVEVFVPVLGHLNADTMCAGIRANAVDRAIQVQGALSAIEKARCDLVVFPGWTLVGRRIPKWVLDASHGRTIVIELLFPEVSGKTTKGPKKPGKDQRSGDTESWYADWRAYVIRDSQIILGNVQQTLSHAWQARDPDFAGNLLATLQAPHERRWAISGGCMLDALLLMCGEANLVRAGSRPSLQPRFVASDSETDVLGKSKLIINAAHYRSPSPKVQAAMEQKRAWLSRGRLLLSTANERSPVDQDAAPRSAAIWRDEKLLVPDEQIGSASNFRLSIYQLSASLEVGLKRGAERLVSAL